MCCLFIILALFSIIVQFLHWFDLCFQSCKSCDYIACVDSYLVECWALTFLFALIIVVNFIIALDKGPLPLSPHICVLSKCVHSGQKVIFSWHRKILKDMWDTIKILIIAPLPLIQHFLHLPRHFVFSSFLNNTYMVWNFKRSKWYRDEKFTFILSPDTHYSCLKVNNVTSFFGILSEILSACGYF